MGNECRTAKNPNDYLDHQLQIYRWRADVRHNTHIARTFISKPTQNHQRLLTKMISYQLSNGPEVNLQELRRECKQEEDGERLKEFLMFQRYCCSIVVLRGQLAMEENVYALNTLLSGYENIHRKLGEICVNERCCFITEEGELRTWINPDATLNQPDYQLIHEENGNRHKALYSSEAGICKRIMDISLQLSNKNGDFIHFYQKLKQFTARNILHNLNFRAIRTFVNGYVYKNRVAVPNSLIKAMQRGNMAADQTGLSNVYESDTLSHQSEDQVSHSNIGIQWADKSMQTSQVNENGISTTFNTPKRDYLNHSKRLSFSSSQFFLKNNYDHMNESLEEENKVSTKCPQFTKKVNFVQSQESNKSLILIPQLEKIKLMRFHSYHPSKSQEIHFKCTQEKEELDLCSMKHSRNVSTYQQNHAIKTDGNLSIQDSSQDSRFQRESRALTRVVSGLVSNKEITVCQSMGSFQSINRSNDSGYQGVLLTMGRSVMNNEPTRKRLSNLRGPNNRAPHATY